MWDPPPIEMRGRFSAPGSIVTEQGRFVVLPVRTCVERSEPWIEEQAIQSDRTVSGRKRHTPHNVGVEDLCPDISVLPRCSLLTVMCSDAGIVHQDRDLQARERINTQTIP